MFLVVVSLFGGPHLGALILFRYCLRELKQRPYRSLQDVVKEAQKKWSDIADDKTVQESFLHLREYELPSVRYDKDGFEIEEKIPARKRSSFVVGTSSSESTSPSLDTSKKQADDVAEIPTKPPRLQTSQVPDVVDLLSNETEKQKAGASRIFNKKLVESACFLFTCNSARSFSFVSYTRTI